MKPVIVITVRGGLVAEVNATAAVTVFVEDWDCPPDSPLVMVFECEPLTPEQDRRVKESLSETTPETVDMDLTHGITLGETGDQEVSMTAMQHSPAPWSYGYSPYTRQSENHPNGAETEIPAFEVFDADCNKIFDTNEDTPCELQEANARMAATAPRLLASLVTCANLLADYDESDGEEGKAYREALAAITEATGR